METYIVWAGRLVLSVIFIWAAAGKIVDPQAFARALWNYRLLPEAFVPMVAVALPLFEALAALAILAPPFQKGASMALAGLLAVFTFGLASALIRGLDVDCGCFGEGSSHVSPILLVRNVGLMALAVWSYLRAPFP